MTALDVKQAKQALAWRLREWGTEEPDARAASFIDDLVSKGWQMSPERESRPRPPKNGEQCRTCNRAMHQPDRVCGSPTTRPPQPDPNTTTNVARLRALVNAAGTEPEEGE